MANRLVIGDAPRTRGRRRWPMWFVGSVVFLVVLRFFVVSFAEVRGDSMAPNALEGDILLVLHGASPAVGDVVVVDGEPNPVLRRILGIAGDRISAEGGRLVRNGDALESRSLGHFSFREHERILRQHLYWEALSPESGHCTLADYVSAPRAWRLEFGEESVPEDHVFVFCDNRRHCPMDSRSGVVPLSAVSGVAWGTMWFGEVRQKEPPDRPFLGAYSPLRSAAGPSLAGVSSLPDAPRR